MEEINWAKYGFKDQWSNGNFSREGFPLMLSVYNGFLNVNYWEKGEDIEYIVSEGKIPATNQSVVLLLKAFACPKLP